MGFRVVAHPWRDHVTGTGPRGLSVVSSPDPVVFWVVNSLVLVAL